MERSEKKFLCWLFCFAFALRLLFFYAFLINNPCKITFDSGHYHNLAVRIASGQGLTNVDGASHFYRLPGYPFFLAACYKIFGENPDAALIIQMLLGSLIPLLIFFFARLLFPVYGLTARFAGMLAAINLGLVLFSGLVMTEILFEIFFLLFLYCVIKKIYDPDVSDLYLLCAGLSLGAVALIRPGGQYLIPFALTLFVLFYQQTFLAVVRAVAILGMSTFAVVSWWLVRNFLLTGYFFFSTLPGPHLLNHGAVPITMQYYKMSHEQAKDYVYGYYAQQKNIEEDRLSRSLSVVEVSFLQEKVARDLMRQHSWTSVKYFLKNIFKTISSLYSSELLFIDSGGQLPEYSTERGLRDMIMRYLNPAVSNKLLIFVIYYELLLWAIIFFGAFGFFILSFINRYYLYIYALLWPYVFLFIGLTIVCGYARLRLPIEPFLIMLASEFWISFVCGKREMSELAKK